jgi:hypothetical protein
VAWAKALTSEKALAVVAGWSQPAQFVGWLGPLLQLVQSKELLRNLEPEVMGAWLNTMASPTVINGLTRLADARVSGRWVIAMSDPQVVAALSRSVTPETLIALMQALAQVSPTSAGVSIIPENAGRKTQERVEK